MPDQHSSQSTGDPMDLKVVQLATQLLKNGFDNFAEREQLQQPARPYGGNIRARVRRIDRGATPSHGLAENAPRIRRAVTLIYLKVRAVSRRGSPDAPCTVHCCNVHLSCRAAHQRGLNSCSPSGASESWRLHDYDNNENHSTHRGNIAT